MTDGDEGRSIVAPPADPSPEAVLLSALGRLQIHDASSLIEPGMPMFIVFDGPQITPLSTHAQGGVASNQLTLAEHTGTHVDAPFHFDQTGATIDCLAPDVLLMRPYKKFDLSGDGPRAGESVGVASLERAARRGGFGLEPGDVAIIEMGWDRHWPDGSGDRTRSFWGLNMPGLDESACAYLANAGVTAVASDTAACDNAVRDGELGDAPGHSHWFLPRGLLIVEGLRGLAQVSSTGLFLALPLRIAGGTASPLRVLLLHRGTATLSQQ
jgi:arylformamidase